jgi:hypothetical protein
MGALSIDSRKKTPFTYYTYAASLQQEDSRYGD